MSRAEKLATISVDVEELSDLADQVQEIETAIQRANTNAQEIDSISDSLEELSAINSIYNSGISYSTDGVNEYFDANTPNNTLTSTEFIEMNLTNPQEGDLMSFDAAANNWINSAAPEEPIPVLSFRNKIINGGMQIDQRNAGSSVTPASGGYTVDRWVYEATQSSKVACQQVSTAPTRFVNSLKSTSQSAYTVAAGDVFQIVQRIEGSAISELAWGTTSASTVTLSFKAYSSLTGTFGGFLRNSANDRYYVFTYSIPVANTWTDISITIPGDTTGTWLTTNGYGLGVGWSLGCGSTYQTTAGSWGSGNNRGATGQVDLVATNGAELYITGVQLEEGTVATPFEHRPIGMELNLCNRYFQQGPLTAFPTVIGSSSTYFATNFRFSTPMRATPSLTFFAPSSGNVGKIEQWGGTEHTISSVNVGSNNAGIPQNQGIMYIIISSGIAVSVSLGAVIKADAEL